MNLLEIFEIKFLEILTYKLLFWFFRWPGFFMVVLILKMVSLNFLIYLTFAKKIRF